MLDQSLRTTSNKIYNVKKVTKVKSVCRALDASAMIVPHHVGHPIEQFPVCLNSAGALRSHRGADFLPFECKIKPY
jgi:hypothetical protein